MNLRLFLSTASAALLAWMSLSYFNDLPRSGYVFDSSNLQAEEDLSLPDAAAAETASLVDAR
jgi:Fe-S cluster assembly iron-binding protein IscA